MNTGSRYRVHAEDNHAFLFLGRLSPEKGIREFCRAVHETHAPAIVIGEGDLRTELEAQFHEITFTGWLNKDEIRGQFEKTRCLVLPSVCYETFGLPAYEAEAFGIPVIASDCSAASDDAAFTYNSQSELEELIRQVSRQDIKELSIRTYENFDESFTADYADKLLEIYSSPLD